MPSKSSNNTVSHYTIGQHDHIALFEDASVWAPYSAIYILKTLKKSGYTHLAHGKKILDIGTGTGILGLYLLKHGARFTCFVDNNQRAVDLTKKNALYNKCVENVDFATIKSDVFEKVNNTYDVIVSNPPVQPNIPSVHINDPAAKSNQSHEDGRWVLDKIIQEGKKYLSPSGRIVFSNSSRHGYESTAQLLDKHWGPNKWKIINTENDTFEGKEEQISDSYHGPYMPYWKQKQTEDGQLRVYQKNFRGEAMAVNSLNGSTSIILLHTVINGQVTKLKMVVNKNQIEECYKWDNNKLTKDKPLNNYTLLLPEPDSPWYYRYYITEISG